MCGRGTKCYCNIILYSSLRCVLETVCMYTYVAETGTCMSNQFLYNYSLMDKKFTTCTPHKYRERERESVCVCVCVSHTVHQLTSCPPNRINDYYYRNEDVVR